MATRLSGQDAAFFHVEDAASPSHLCTLAVIERAHARIGYEELLELVERRLNLVPRYRRRVREVAGGFMRPVWVDDADFDISYHVRRSALPAPGTQQQLNDLLARLIARPLDHGRPLWELYVIEGLEDDHFAVFTKTHQSVVDAEGGALDIGQVLLDCEPQPREPSEDAWMPRPEPGSLGLVVDGLASVVSRPRTGLDIARYALGDVTDSVGRMGRVAGQFAAMVRGAAAPAPPAPLTAKPSPNRRFCVASAELSHFKKIRARYGGTINDAALAVVSGVLRSWLVSRGYPVTASTTVRVLVPLSVFPGDRTAPGSPPLVAAEPPVPGGYPMGPANSGTTMDLAMVDLPLGEANPVVRLSQISHAMSVRPGAARAIGARNLMWLSGFAPPTMHARGARLTGSISRRSFHLVVTNAPGPQEPLYFAGARLTAMYPVLPLVPGQALSIGLTSYDGVLYFGFHADRGAMPDVDMLPGLVREALDELDETL